MADSMTCFASQPGHEGQNTIHVHVLMPELGDVCSWRGPSLTEWWLPCRSDGECVHAQLGASDAVLVYRWAQHPVCRGSLLQDAGGGRQSAAQLVQAADRQHHSHSGGPPRFPPLARAGVTLCTLLLCGPGIPDKIATFVFAMLH